MISSLELLVIFQPKLAMKHYLVNGIQRIKVFFFKNGHALFQGKIFKNDWKFWYFFQKSSFQWMFVKNSWNFCGSTLSYCKFKFVFSHDPQWQTRASIVDQIRTWGYIEKTTGQTIWLFLNYDSSDRVGP